MARSAKIVLHPLYLAMAVFYVCIGKWQLLMANFIAVIVHELAHQKVAQKQGYCLEKIVLMPYGAILSGKEQFPRKIGVTVAIAGVAVNLAICIILLAIWWLVPSVFVYTEQLFYANLTLVLFNLMPCYPLDGARALLAISSNRLRTLKILRIASLVMGAGFIIIGFVSIWYVYNASIIFVGVFLIFSFFSYNDREVYVHIADNMPFLKDFANGVERVTYEIDGKVQLSKIIKLLKPNKRIYLMVQMADSDVGLTEEDLQKILIANELSATLADCIVADKVKKN